jgi:hypothetical protein
LLLNSLLFAFTCWLLANSRERPAVGHWLLAFGELPLLASGFWQTALRSCEPRAMSYEKTAKRSCKDGYLLLVEKLKQPIKNLSLLTPLPLKILPMVRVS